MLRVNPGFNPVGLGFAQIWIPVPNDPSKDPYGSVSRRNAFVSEVLRRVEALPGVQSAAMGNITQVPFGGTGVTSRFVFAGESDAPSMIKRSEFRVVSSAYFNVLQSPLIGGRVFADLDTDKAEKVAIVNQAFVRNFSSGSDLIGKSLSLLAKDQIYKIVGVVGDIHDDGLDAPVLPRIYFSSYQRPGKALALFFRMTGDPGRLDRVVEETIHAVDPTLPVFGQTTMQHLINASETRRKFTLALMSGFALTALLLAALGIYGVVSYSASQRFNEIGIRMAIGARQPDIVYLILGPGLRLAAVGVAIGTMTALLLTRFMRSLLFIVSPTDSLTYTLLSVLIIAVSAVACFIPARRAARLDPLVALRRL
jgi:putative ABC transport system permease protein